MSDRDFHHITPAEIAWHLDLGKDDPDFVDLFWLDAGLDNGWQVGIGLYRCRPHDGGRPAITVNLLRPGKDVVEVHETYEAAAFTPTEFGGRWGDDNVLAGTFDTDGRPASVRLSVAIDGVRIELAGTVVCAGVKFTSASPGYTHYREETGTAVGWWPVAPRTDVTGRITVDGEETVVTGAAHLEKQLSSLPLAGEEGAPSAQSVWTWGHFTCGDYTGIWTDSAASARLGYRHFTPFVLYRGSEPVLSTFASSSSVERFTTEPSTGLPRPQVVTLKASDGQRDFFARLLDGRVSDQFELNGVAGAYYCRQVGRIEAEIHHWGARTRIDGEAVHEWGTQAGNFPFERSRRGDHA
ncbi:hypothetical protein [Mumia sp. DW29H23]|uniref:hypothetical protein n=1 Tax=Mumia sp. DW29H23 TaxID=3421241 RepID=UPI003D69C7E0